VRFICEWCYAEVRIVDERSPHTEVLAHFTSCSRRSLLVTDEQVAGLAQHIAKIVSSPRSTRKVRRAG
jgi:hypothetical protein